ncbi:DUF4382 domain-containing protein [Corallincola spongiicola]|uniref:DUF4382 domain-containing protein n=1 Tax=Corallincola spongiicola TaxID=2520508 RepID=A0ABY1WNA0_9GAMM|nr:DUF4382 domain-containing protein [Corallincola spongiicola]TAA45042.1 DUF4382 domain-containing protein [Corallincola spongiicola]
MMRFNHTKWPWIAALVISTSLLGACSDDDDDEDDDTGEIAAFTLGVSDAPVDDANKVVITIDTVTLRREGADDLVFETFNNSDEGITDAETIQIDLLEFQGGSQFIIIEGEDVPEGSYSDMLLEILDEDVALSYVEETDGAIKSIKVPSDELKLGGFEVSADAPQNFTIEFNLRKSMTYKPGPDEYNLKPRGVSLANNADTGTLMGTIDLDTLLADPMCADSGHIVYLYAGSGLDASLLSDEFDPDVANNGAPEGAIAPFASTGIMMDEDSGNYVYELGFVPAGTHTLAYACDAGEAGDDPELYDGITVPMPANNVTEVTVTAGADTVQDFPLAMDTLTLGISDAPVDDVDEVVITIDVITLKQEGNDDQVFDCFTVDAEEGDTDDESCDASTEEGKVAKDTITLNLLDYTGGEQFILLEDEEVAPGDYNDVWLDVIDEDTDFSYVNEQLPEGDDPQDDSFIKELKLPSGTLKLGGFSLGDTGSNLTIDFNLRKSMTYNPGPDRYILKPRGVSLVDNAGTGTISGMVGDTLMTSAECAADGAISVAYLYAGSPEGTLGDEYDPEMNPDVTAVEPFASVATDETGAFNFGFVPVGTHTLTLHCGTTEDDPDSFEGLAIPTPTDATVAVTVAEDTETSCDLSVDDACAPVGAATSIE